MSPDGLCAFASTLKLQLAAKYAFFDYNDWQDIPVVASEITEVIVIA
jgi:hypothetical protein